jgi:hypothetical protein
MPQKYFSGQCRRVCQKSITLYMTPDSLESEHSTATARLYRVVYLITNYHTMQSCGSKGHTLLLFFSDSISYFSLLITSCMI